jgi:ParB-like chromosome segregation protein Spo0J
MSNKRKTASHRKGRGGDSPADGLRKAVGEVSVDVELSSIKYDPENVQVRVNNINENNLQRLIAVLENDGEIKDPVLVYKVNGDLILVDGFHRYEAHQAVGREMIKAIVRIGSFDEALEAAETANLEHGEPLTNADKKAMLWRRLERGHGWVQASDSAIAEKLGVNRTTIGRWIADYNATRANAQVDRSKRVGADGREYDTSKTTTANQQDALNKLVSEYRWLNEDDVPFEVEQVSEARRIIQERLADDEIDIHMQHQYATALNRYYESQGRDGDNLWMSILEQWFDYHYPDLHISEVVMLSAGQIAAADTRNAEPVTPREDALPIVDSEPQWDVDDDPGPELPENPPAPQEPSPPGRSTEDLAIIRMDSIMRHTVNAQTIKGVSICRHLSANDHHRLVDSLKKTISWASDLLAQLGVQSDLIIGNSLAENMFKLLAEPSAKWLIVEIANDLEALGYYVEDEWLPNTNKGGE